MLVARAQENPGGTHDYIEVPSGDRAEMRSDLMGDPVLVIGPIGPTDGQVETDVLQRVGPGEPTDVDGTGHSIGAQWSDTIEQVGPNDPIWTGLRSWIRPIPWALRINE